MGNLKLRQLARQLPTPEHFQIKLSNTERCISDPNRGAWFIFHVLFPGVSPGSCCPWVGWLCPSGSWRDLHRFATLG